MKFQFSTVIILAFLFSNTGVKAQKLRDDPVKIKFVHLPQRQLPDDHKTFSVNVRGPLFAQAGSSSGTAAKSLKMDGFKKIAGTGSNGGHLRTEIYGGETSYGQPSAKTRTVSSKDKEGNVKKSHYYYYEVPARCNTNFKIYNPAGEVVHRGESANDVILKTAEWTSTKSRSSNRTRDIQKVVSKHATSSMNGVISRAQAGLKMYDYDFDEDRYNLYLIRKHASEDQWTKHYEIIKAAYAESDFNTSSEILKEKLNPSIAFYEQYANKNPKGDKKLKRIYKAANYNLAILHYTVDEFDVAKSYAENVIASEKRDRRSKLIIEKMEKVAAKMEKAEINTIHYARDLSDAMPPSKIAALEAEKEELEENTSTAEGSIFKGSEEIKGTWSLDSEAKDLIFGEGGNIKFIIEEGAEMKEVDLIDPDVSKFEVAERTFNKMRFVPSAKGGTEASMEILEEIYSSERIKLFKFYPSTGALSDDKPEFAFQKTGQEFPLSLESTMFLLLKKGLAKYFADCPDLAEMSMEGGIEKTKDSLIKAARVYSELCEVVIKP